MREQVRKLLRLATEAGKQPYMDFWYNNSWVPEV